MRAYATVARPDAARARLISEHVDMARRIALRVARRVPPHLTQDDLIASAMIGLTEAADRYDAGRGEPFVAFAEKRIRGAVLDELRRGDVMPRRVRKTAREVGETLRELEQKLGRPPEDEEMALALNVSLDEYRDELEGLTQVSFVELSTEQEGLRHLGSSPEADAERSQLVSRVREGITRLAERDALVLSLYYVEELGYAQIGEVLGVSESRVCQLHARALARLRTELAPASAEAA